MALWAQRRNPASAEQFPVGARLREGYIPMVTNDIIALIANVALTLSFIVAVVFGITQVRAASRDRRERLTLEALRNFETRDFAELMQYINSHTIPSSSQWLAQRISKRMQDEPRKPYYEKAS